jgi:pyruvate-formate lyase-activating enzyme
MNKPKQVFPIVSDTACLLKWAWSTVYLGQGTSSSCHRTDQAPIDPDNFANFHNLPNKVAARKQMQEGTWPQGGCQYCEKIESAGGMSDRQYQLHAGHDLDRTPRELLVDPTVTEVVPTILEVYFNNTCNMACVYCGSWFSTKWEEENRRFGMFRQGRVNFGYNKKLNPDYERMLTDFWRYLHEKDRYQHIRYYQILGGEPFFQPEFDTSIEFWETHANPELTFNIITNLKVAPAKFRNYIDRFERMVQQKQLKQLQITGSLDAWGPQEEYVRWGLNLSEWEENFTYLLDKPWVVMCVNATITGLTIKTLPELIQRITRWNLQRPVHNPINFSFMSAMTPPEMVPDIFGAGVFESDFERILEIMPDQTELDRSARNHMSGIMQQITQTPRNIERIEDLKVYLTELDRRRNTDWTDLFPWLNQDWTQADSTAV